LVAGIYDELGIGFVPDKAIEQDFKARKVSIGQAVKVTFITYAYYFSTSKVTGVGF
jgi:hypothetical protein